MFTRIDQKPILKCAMIPIHIAILNIAFQLSQAFIENNENRDE